MAKQPVKQRRKAPEELIEFSLTINLSKEQDEFVRRKAHLESVSMGEVVRRAVEKERVSELEGAATNG